MQVTMALAVALFLLGTSHNANAQSLSVNPSAAASEVRNPSSINPAAAASDVRNPSAINPSARASQISSSSAISSTRPAGVAPTAPRQRAVRRRGTHHLRNRSGRHRETSGIPNLRPLLPQHLSNRTAGPVKRLDLVKMNSSNNGTRLQSGQ